VAAQHHCGGFGDGAAGFAELAKGSGRSARAAAEATCSSIIALSDRSSATGNWDAPHF